MNNEGARSCRLGRACETQQKVANDSVFVRERPRRNLTYGPERALSVVSWRENIHQSKR